MSRNTTTVHSIRVPAYLSPLSLILKPLTIKQRLLPQMLGTPQQAPETPPSSQTSWLERHFGNKDVFLWHMAGSLARCLLTCPLRSQGRGTPALMWYASSSAPSGTVSPRWIMRRMACTSGVRNSCALGLNSSLAHLQQRVVLKWMSAHVEAAVRAESLCKGTWRLASEHHDHLLPQHLRWYFQAPKQCCGIVWLARVWGSV